MRRGNPGDIARLARILDNRAIGVVLGGGGSRGYAHIGVIRAFEELGIPIDAMPPREPDTDRGPGRATT